LNSDTVRLHLDVECRGNHNRPAEETCSIQVMMTEELTKKVVVWATEIATYAAELPSSRARDAYLAERRRELEAGAVAEGAAERDAAILADACVSAARRIMTELLAHRAGLPRGRA
jgi:hypothetical protein